MILPVVARVVFLLNSELKCVDDMAEGLPLAKGP